MLHSSAPILAIIVFNVIVIPIVFVMWNSHAFLIRVGSLHSLNTDHRLLICFVAVAQQLQQFESEVFGSNMPSTPIINTSSGGATFGFGYSAPPPEAIVPTFALPMTNSLSQAPLFGSIGTPAIPNSNFVFGAVKHEPRAAMDHSMDG